MKQETSPNCVLDPRQMDNTDNLTQHLRQEGGRKGRQAKSLNMCIYFLNIMFIFFENSYMHAIYFDPT